MDTLPPMAEQYAQELRSVEHSKASLNALRIQTESQKASLERRHNQLSFWQKIKARKQYRKGVREQDALLEKSKDTHHRLSRDSADKRRQILTDMLAALVEQSPDKDSLASAQAAYAEVCKLHRAQRRLVSLGQEALRKIGNAESSVDSASMTEVVDLFTKSKGLSALSTFNTMGASNDVDSARRAIQRFSDAAKSQSVDAERVRHSMVTEYLDLGLDFFMPSMVFDIGSVLSLMSLSSASSKLGEARRSLSEAVRAVEEAERALNEERRREEAAIVEVKRALFSQALAALEAAGAAAPDEELVASILRPNDNP